MPLDIHRVRQLCSDSDRQASDAKRVVQKTLESFRSLGSGFTADRLYSREYSKLVDATKEAEPALDKVQSAVRDIKNKA